MNLYKFHSNPEQLKFHDEATEKIPKFAWEKYYPSKRELKKREKLWATDALYAYRYAHYILKKPWPLGEAVIAGDEQYSKWYAREFNLKLVHEVFQPC